MPKRKPFIGVAFPSRGYGHLRSVFGLIREVEPYRHSWHQVFGLPIPESHNLAVASALADKRVEYVFLAEDDHLFPTGVLAAMVAEDAPVVTVDYQLRNGEPLVKRHPLDGSVTLTGLGCILIRRDVFSQIANPPFQVGRTWELNHGEWSETERYDVAGGHDPFFTRQCRTAGIPITVLDGWQVGHLEVVHQADRLNRANVGVDEIKCWGGMGDLPMYPRSRRNDMGKTVFLKLSGGFVLPMDQDNDNYGVYTRAGATEISESAAKPLMAKQAKQETVRVDIANNPPVDDDDD